MRESEFSKSPGHDHFGDSHSSLNLLDLLKFQPNSFKLPDLNLPKDFQTTTPQDQLLPLMVSADSPSSGSDGGKLDGGKELTVDNARRIVENRETWTGDELGTFMQKWSPADREVGLKLFNDGGEVTPRRIDSLRDSARYLADLEKYHDAQEKAHGPRQKLDWNPRQLVSAVGAWPLDHYKNYFALTERIGTPHRSSAAQTFSIAQTHLAKLPDETVKSLIVLNLDSKHNLRSIPPAEISRLIPAAKAWEMCPDLPIDVAEKVGAMPLKDQMRATVAWNQVSDGKFPAPGTSGDTKEKFWTAFSDLNKLDARALFQKFGEISISQNGDPEKTTLALVKGIFPEKSTGQQETIAEELRRYAGADKKINPAELLLGMNKKVFDKAVDLQHSTAHALRAALVFQDYDQYMKFRESAGGYNASVALDFLNSQTAKDLTGLSDWLLKPVEPGTNLSMSAMVSESWTELTPSQKKMGRLELTNLVSAVREELFSENMHIEDHSSVKSLRPVFLAVERFPDLSLPDKQLLSAVVIKHPQVAESLKKESLSEALNGWRVEKSFSQDLAVKVASMPTWHQVAAKMAWNQTLDGGDVGSRSEESAKAHHEKFLIAFENQKAKGKMSVLMENGDPFLAAQSMFPKIPTKILETLAEVCVQSTPEGENRVKKLNGLQCGAFRDALAALASKPGGLPVNPMDLPPGFNPENWQARSAFGLSTTFGKEWKKWVDKMADRGVNAHDATHWLPLRAPEEMRGLKEFLLRNSERDIDDLAKVARRWNELKPEQRELKFKELVNLIESVKFLNARSPEFAVENARWGVSELEYPKRENRYLASLNTPSPFPLDKRWESGNLQGYFLPRNDPRGLYLGNHTGCCQHPDGEAATSAWHGQESPNGGFFVVVDKTKPGAVLATSWAWVSDDGGLCFDSIEAINLTGREKDVMNVYKRAATDLAVSKFHTVTVSTASQYQKIAGNPPEASTVSGLKLPSNYSGYTDTKRGQVILAQNSSLPKRVEADKLTWVRGMTDADKAKANAIAKAVYPPGWQRAESGDFKLVLDNHKDGMIGYAVLNRETKEVHDIAVLPEHRSKSLQLLRDVLKHISATGGEWTCSARESTSFAVLKLAERRGMIKINEAKVDGEMNGEKMYAVKFEVVSQKDLAASNAKPALDKRLTPEDQKPGGPATTAFDTAKHSVKAATELNKQITSAIELLNSPTVPGGKPPELKDLTPDEFKRVLETAITKMKNNPDVSSDELVLIDEIQKALDSKDPGDAVRLATLQKDLASLKPVETTPIPSAGAGGVIAQSRSNTKANSTKPAESHLPSLTIVAAATEIANGTHKKDGKLEIIEEKPTRDNRTGDSAKKPGMKPAAKYVVGGVGAAVGILTVAEGTLQLYEWLKEKGKDGHKK